HDRLFLGEDGAALRVRQEVVEHADWQSLRHPAAPVYTLVFARLEGNALDQLRREIGNADRAVPAIALDPGLLLRDRAAELGGQRVMRRDFRADSVFERRNDLA